MSNQLSKPNEPAHKLVTRIRPVTYRRGDQIVGVGTEIVSEILVIKESYDNAIASGFQPSLDKGVERFLPFIKREDKAFRY